MLATEKPSLVEENRRLHKLIVEGVDVEFYTEDGTIRGDKVRLIDFDDLAANDWLATGQFTVIEGSVNRRPDVVVFVNGLPLGVIELKAPGGENATLVGRPQPASDLQVADSVAVQDECGPRNFGRRHRAYRLADRRSRAFHALAHDRREGHRREGPAGTQYPDRRHFRSRADFSICFMILRSSVRRVRASSKIIAGYHQFHAVRHAVEKTVEASAPQGDRKVGVIWHTQGSGKSLLMAFYAGQLVRRPELENPTIVVITDRNDLDDQLFGTFSMCRDLIRQTPIQADSRDDLAIGAQPRRRAA